MTDTRTLLSSLAGLAPVERAIVQVLAVAYDGTPRTTVLQAVRALGENRAPNGKALTSASILPVLDQLVAKGVVLAENYAFRCPAPLAGALLESLAAERRLITVANALAGVVKRERAGLGELRVALYAREFERAIALVRSIESYQQDPLEMLLRDSFDERWLRTWPEPLIAEALSGLIERAWVRVEPCDQAFALLEALCAERARGPELRELLALVLSLRGRADEAPRWLGGEPVTGDRAVDGWLAFLQRDGAAAVACAEKRWPAPKQTTALPGSFAEKLALLGAVLSLVERGEHERALALSRRPRVRSEQGWLESVLALGELLGEVAAGGRHEGFEREVRLPAWTYRQPPAIEQAFRLFAVVWFGIAGPPDAPRAEALRTQAGAAGWRWLGEELDDVRAAIAGSPPTGRARLREVVTNNEPWRRALDALDRLLAAPAPVPIEVVPTKASTDVRLAWVLEFRGPHCDIRPTEQKLQARGQWSQGRRVALKRLHEEAVQMHHLDAQDRKIVATLSVTTQRFHGYPETYYAFDTPRALRAMLGHPRVYLEGNPPTHIELVEGRASVAVVRDGEHLVIKLDPPLERDQPFALVRTSPTRVHVVFPSTTVAQYGQILGAGITVPAREQARVTKLLDALSAVVPVQSALGVASESAREVPAVAAPVVQLRPREVGLAVKLVVRPFGTPEPHFKPGIGAETILSELDGKHVQTRRSLEAERNEVVRLLEACPTLNRWPELESEWLVVSNDEALELLLELDALEGVAVEWPNGGQREVRAIASPGHLSLHLTSHHGGFRAAGTLQIEGVDGPAIELGKLLELIEASPGRFVKLGAGEFIALTHEFLQRLQELSALSERRGKVIEFNPLAGAALEPWLDQCHAVVGDAQWKQFVARLREAREFEPAVPSTLRAELRPYQLDGYRWLARLAYWGAGACLADDMGLGKTLQALALLLSRAPDGPALVVAPASVGLGWIDEAQRFAPTLRCVWLADADRERLLAAPQPFDVVVTSYGLLLHESEALARVKWHTVVLDEAQAIKNATAQRSTAAMSLQGAFKLVTTGTPIENNLGELWNLFRFLNPGLLGPRERFDARFAVPIEKHKDRAAGTRLKRLVQPFILRRTKSQVLPELPARTEVTVRVDLGAEEAALYEALRQRAIDALSGTRAGHVKVLGELMRLRRACCHPRLVVPESTLPGAKLAAFAELEQELRGSRHRALVFSQFVDHLDLIRAYFDERGVRYQHLDGSTPIAERKRRVDAFQAGDGEFFLISLRAGGVGLNLTGADSVIHLDPWWNPAVEDQASDRAHRMGQTRPVTVYRLIARHTIEEKIVALHDSKRELADRLLEGTDVSGSLSVDELLRLLHDA